MKKLAIIITHPIQYYVPVFQLLAKQCNLKIFYTWGKEALQPKHDPGFGKTIVWDIPLLEGYEYEFLENIAPDKGSHHFKGINNPEIIKRIEYFNPDRILIYGWSYQSHLKVLRYFKGKTPVWFRGDSTLLDQQKIWKKTLRSILLHWIYKHIDKAIYVGSANKAYFLKYGIKEEQLTWAPHAIDHDRFSINRNSETEELRNQLGIPKEAILLLYAGKLEAKKDPELLLNAFIKQDNSAVHLLFAGNGKLEENLKNTLSTLDFSIAKRIHFIDFQNQSQMPVLYQACDLFCLPSQGPGETWGLAVNEAMACSKAILVSDKVGCAQDLVKPVGNGYIFKSKDETDLLEKLQLLCSSKDQLIKMGKQSGELIKNWTIEKQVSAIIKELTY